MTAKLQFSTLAEMFDHLPAYEGGDQRTILQYKIEGSYHNINYRQLHASVIDCALGLASLGLKRGDRVAVISENRPEWVIADFALIHLGGVNVSIYPTLSSRQIEYILSDSGARYVILSSPALLRKVAPLRATVRTVEGIISFSADPGDPSVIRWQDLLERGRRFAAGSPSYWDEERAKVRPDDLLTLIYTSGTTGTPKGVMLTHRNLTSNMFACARSISFSEKDNILSFLPLCHSYERMAGYYTAMSCGVRIAFAESIDSVPENLLEIRPTVMMMVPRLAERVYYRLTKKIDASPVWKQLVFRSAFKAGREYREELRAGTLSLWTAVRYGLADRLVFRPFRERLGGRIRFLVSGGAALSATLAEFFEAAGVIILEGYGMTESSPVISFNRLENYRFGTVGQPIPGVEVKIAGDGEILVRGPNVMKGYWNDKESTCEAIDSDGWLHTGDIGTLDEGSFLTITDRKKHLFVSSGGKNIAPQPIENIFLQHKLIDQFVLIGDGRMFLTALIVPDFTALREVAGQLGVVCSSVSELVHNEQITGYFERELNRVQKDLANYERVRKFTILDRPLTQEEGEITPTLKVRRKFVEERYKDIIEAMYHGID